MIKKKSIIILLVVLIALCGATYALFSWEGVSEENTDNDLSSEDTIYIYNGNEDELSKINVILPDDEFEFVKLEEDKWQITGLEGTSIKNYSITMLASDVSKLTAKSVVEENASDLAKYGLDNPTHIISGTFGDTVKTFYGGNATPLNDGYYFKDADSDTVYTVYTTRFTSLFSDKESYRDISFIKVDTSAVKRISIVKSDYEIDMALLENPVQMSGYTLAGWEMTKPSQNYLDDSRLSTLVIEKLSQISVKSVANDKGDFSSYGLNNPYAVITITDGSDVTQTIKISPADGGDYYASTDGDNSIYLINGEPMSFVNVKAFDLISKFAHICSIDDVSSVLVSSGDESFVMEISGSEDSKVYKLNGTEIDEDIFKKDLYQGVIGLICTDFCTDAKYANPEVVIEYVMNDGTKTKVDFVNYSDRNYAVFKDGSCSMQLLKKDVKALIDTLRENSK